MKFLINSIFTALFFFTAVITQAKVIYVDIDATGTETGTSWTNAFTNVETAYASSVDGDELWIAKGEYALTVLTGLSIDKNISFFGGFEGGELNFDDRDETLKRAVFSNSLNNGSLAYYTVSNISVEFNGINFNSFGMWMSSQNSIGNQNIVVKNSTMSQFSTGAAFSANSSVYFENVELSDIGTFITDEPLNSFTMTKSKYIDAPFFVIEANTIDVQNTEFKNIGYSRFSNDGGTVFIDNCLFDNAYIQYVGNSIIDNFLMTNSKVTNTPENFDFVVKAREIKFENCVFQDIVDIGNVINANGSLGAKFVALKNISVNNVKGRDFTTFFVFNDIETLAIEGLSVTNSEAGNVLVARGVEDIVIDGLKLINNEINSDGIVTNTPNFLFKNSIIEGNTLKSAAYTMIGFASGGEIRFEDVIFKDNICEGTFLNFLTGNPVFFEDVIFENNQISAHLMLLNYSGLELTSFLNVDISGNIFEGPMFTQRSVYDYRYDNVNISNNTLGLSLSRGSSILPSGNYDIINSKFNYNSGWINRFIDLDEGSSIKNSEVVGNNLASTGANRFITLLKSNADGLLIKDNIIDALSVGSRFGSLIELSNSQLDNVVIIENIQDEPSDLIVLYEASEISNSTIVNNYCERELFYFASGNINNSIVWGNSFTKLILNLFLSRANIQNSNIQGGFPGTGNLDVDPLFVDPNNGDFRLTCASHLLDKGNNEFAPNTPDPNGVPRIRGDFVDMGAYEFDGDPKVSSSIPVPDFAVTNASPCLTEEVSFINTTGLDVSYYTYSWDYGDGSPLSSDTNAVHAYTNAGTFEITLVATNACGLASSISKTITVQSAVIPTINFATTTCAEDTVSFVSSANCTNMDWAVANGNIIDGLGTSEIKVAFNDGALGKGVVSLSATSCNNPAVCELPTTIDVPIVVNQVSFSGEDTVCYGSQELYKVPNVFKVPGALYSWTVTGGQISGDNQAYNLDSIIVNWGTNTVDGAVRLVVSHELLDCGASFTMPVRVIPLFSISDVEYVCGESTSNFFIQPSGTFNWSVEGTNSIDPNSGATTWGNSVGSYDVIATSTVLGAFCNIQDTVNVTLIAKPQILEILGDTLVNISTSYTYSLVSDSDIRFVNWRNLGGTFISNTDNKYTVRWDRGEPFSVRAEVTTTNGNCRSGFDTLDIKPDLIFNIQGGDEVCVNTSVVLSSNQDTVSGIIYEWYLNDVLLSGTAASITVDLTKKGSNRVKMIANRGGNLYEATKIVNAKFLSNTLSIEGNELIALEGGGVFDYNLRNTTGFDFNYNIIGGNEVVTNDTTLTVTWDQNGPYEINLTGSKLGETCGTETIRFAVSKANELNDTLVLSGGLTCINETSEFTFQADNQTENVIWSVSNGGTILTQNSTSAKVSWGEQPGTYLVTVNYDRFGPQTTTFEVTILDLPAPVIQEATICGGTNAPLLVQGSYDTYKWYAVEDNVLLSINASTLVDEAGFYKVEVTDEQGCLGVASRYIESIPIIEADLEVPGGTYCSKDEVVSIPIQAYNGTNYAYQWFENGAAVGTNSPILKTLELDLNQVQSVKFKVVVTALTCEQSSPEYTFEVKPADQCRGGTGTTCPESVSFTVNDCQPFNFVNTSSQADGFKWNFGNGSGSLLRDASVRYNSIGKKTVTLTHGCARATKQLEVPVTAAYAVPKVLCQNAPIEFKDLSVNLIGLPITSYEWNFGDGTMVTGNEVADRSINHTYTTDGIYETSLTVRGQNSSGGDCEHTYSLTIEVKPEPLVGFSIVVPDCDDDLYTFENTGAEGEYTWDLDISTSTNRSPVGRYALGTYSIALNVKDFSKCTNSLTQSFTSRAKVVSSPINSAEEQPYICFGDSVLLTAPLSEGAYIWFNDGVRLSASNQQFYAKEIGNYTVVYVASGCDVVSQVKRVNSFVPNLNIVALDSACENKALELEIATNNPFAFDIVWKKDGVNLLEEDFTLQIDTLTNADDGAYSALITEKLSGCVYELASYDIQTAPNPTIPILPTNLSACYNDDVSVTTSLNVDETAQWFVNNTPTQSTAGALSILEVKNSFDLKVEVKNTVSGCFSGSLPVQVAVDDFRVIDLAPDQTVCENASFEMTTGLTSDGLNFEWFKSDTLLSESGVSLVLAKVALSNAGVYKVKATTTGNVAGCVTLSDSLVLTVLEGPEAPLITGETDFCKGEKTVLRTNAVINFTWSTGSTLDSIVVFQGGDYAVTVIDTTTGCQVRVVEKITENPLPDFSFLAAGTYELCASSPIDFLGIEDFANYQWKLNGDSIGFPNTSLYPRRSGSYTLVAQTENGCIDESDTIRITSLPCACEVVVTEDDLGVGSLRDALYCANSKAGIDYIYFRIPGDGPHTLRIDSLLPSMNEGIILDGFTQTGEGVYDIIVEAGAYDEQFLEFDFGVTQTEISGLYLKDFQNGVVFNSNADRGLITKNIFENNTTSIHLSNGNRLNRIKDNVFYAPSGTAIEFENNGENIVEENYFDGFEVALDFNNSNSNEIKQNTFVSNTENGITLFNNSNENNITSNIFGKDSLENVVGLPNHAIQIEAGERNVVNSNIILKTVGSAVKVSQSQNTVVASNLFGIDKQNIVYGLDSSAVMVDSSIVIRNNTCYQAGAFGIVISDSSFIYQNQFVDNNKGGVLISGEGVVVSQNTFTNVDGTVKAIDLNGVGNNNKAPALFSQANLEAGQVTLKGTALVAGDTVELFYNNNRNEQALSYIGYTVADASRNWTYAVDAGPFYDVNKRNYYVNTATLEETSQLSSPYMTGCYSCICLVENDNDSGLQSLRAAVDSAHTGACRIINFDIPATSVIQLQTPLRDIETTVTINGISGTQLITIAGTGTGTGFNANHDLFEANNLNLENWDVAVALNGEKALIENINVNQSNTAYAINGGFNELYSSCINCDIETDPSASTLTGIVINGNNNVVGSVLNPNEVWRTSGPGIEVVSGIENELLYNVLSKNGEGIIHTTNGNNNYAAPTNLTAQYVADFATIIGEANTGDRIQVFLSDFGGRSAYEFVTELDVSTNTFVINLPKEVITRGVNQFFILTATDQNGNTSEFSEVVQLGDNTAYCVVSNTDDTGEGSLRAAVTCANNATTSARIVFDLPENTLNEIPVLNSGFEITNIRGVEIDPKQVAVKLTSTSLDYAFTWSVNSIILKNLDFENFDKAIRVAGGNNNIISNNGFVGGDTAVVISGGFNNTVSFNEFTSGGVGVGVYNGTASIDENNFAENGGSFSQGVVLNNAVNSSVSNNDFYETITDQSIVVNNTESFILISNFFYSENTVAEVIEINSSKNGSIKSNVFQGGLVGVAINSSDHISLFQNEFDSISVKAVDLKSSEFIQMLQNTAKGLLAVTKPYELNYNRGNESNEGITIPKFKYATYKKDTLYLRGTAIPESLVEVFQTDKVNGVDLKLFMGSVYADIQGDFTFLVPIDEPENVNDSSYRATNTLNPVFFSQEDALYPPTSEASAPYNPNMKLCYVRNTSDDNILESLRYNINEANQDKCHLILFEVAGTSNPTITLLSDLPMITAERLTIDATSQPGFTNTPVVRLTNGANLSNAFQVNATVGNVAIHGFGIPNFDYTLKIDNAQFFENSLSDFSGFTGGILDATTVQAEEILLEENVFSSRNSDYILDIQTQNVVAKNNAFTGGNKHVIRIASDSAVVDFNSIDDFRLVEGKYAVLSEGSNNALISENTISGFSHGIRATKDTNLFLFDNKILPEVINSQPPTIIPMSVGILADSSFSTQIFANYVFKADTGIYIVGTDSIDCSGNELDSMLNIGIISELNTNAKIANNIIRADTIGILLNESPEIQLLSNIVYGHDSVGVLIDTLSHHVLLANNTIGVRGAFGRDSSWGVGVMIYSSDNSIGGVDTLLNTVARNRKGGVLVIGGIRNEITFNHIFDNDTLITRPSHFAIQHLDSGNIEKAKPTILGYTEVVANRTFEVFGASEPNNEIHLYRSEGFYQNARYYAGKTTADGTGQWSVIIDTSVFELALRNQTLTMVATATDAHKNTSELSDIAYLSTCYVKVNDDNIDNEYPVPNSFRQAVKCANMQSSRDSILFELNPNTSQIGLERQMITLKNKNGVYFNGKSIGFLDTVAVSNAYNIAVADTNNFWVIDSIASNSEFHNLKISFFDTAMYIKADSVILVDGFKFDGNKDYSLLIEEKVKDYTLTNLEVGRTFGSTFIQLLDSVENITISDSKMSTVDVAIAGEKAEKVKIIGNTFKFPVVSIDLKHIDSLLIEGNAVQTGDKVQSILLDGVHAQIRSNTFSELANGIVVSVQNSDSLVIENNTFKDRGNDLIVLNNVNASRLSNNSFGSAKNHIVRFENCDSILVLENKVKDSARVSYFELSNSERIKITRNIITKVEEYDEADSTHLINLNYPISSIVSNDNKQAPIILGYKLRYKDVCSEDDHFGIWLYGTSLPHDTIEIFFSDTASTTFNEFVTSEYIGDTSYWEILIPKEHYKRELDYVYSFVATAIDSNWNTSEESAPIRFDSVFRVLNIKSIANEGSNTLREAIDEINCSDIHTVVRFEIENAYPYTIVLLDSLPEINAWRGFTFDAAGTQNEFHEAGGSIFEGKDPTIVVNAKDFEEYPFFHIENEDAEDGWATISNLDIVDTYKALKVGGDKNIINNIRIETMTIVGDTAIDVDSSANNILSVLTVSGYDIATYISARSSGNLLDSSTISDSKIAVSIEQGTSNNTIQSNQIAFDSVGVSITGTKRANFIVRNVFGSSTEPIENSAVILYAAENQFILSNHMPAGQSSIVDSLQAFILVSDSSHTNTITGNRIGIDSSDFVSFNSDMVGVFVASETDQPLRNNIIASNEIAGLTVPGVIVRNVEAGTIAGNFLGVDSAYTQRGSDKETFGDVVGIASTAIIIDTSFLVNVTANNIVNYLDYGIDVRNSNKITIAKNQILSDKSTNKGIQLNLGTDLESNEGIEAPTLDTNDIIASDRISVSGKTKYPNSTIQLFEGYMSGLDSTEQSLRFIKNVIADENGDWTAELPNENFGFSKYNKYIAQVDFEGNSSEFSSLYTVQSILCRLTASGISLLDDLYEPCPLSNFAIDAQLEGVTYEWAALNGEFDTIDIRIAAIDTSSEVQLTLRDPFGCEHVETLEIVYKERAQDPRFIISSNTFVSDTIVIIDISPQVPAEYDWSSSEGIFIIPELGEEPIVGPDGKEYPPGRFVRFIAPDTGNYVMTQRSLRDGCFVKVDKPFEVTFKDPTIENPYTITAGVNNLTVFPSPVEQGKITNAFISTTGTAEVRASVINLLGEELFSTTLSGKTRYNLPISTSSIPIGVYMLRLETFSDVLVYKFEVQ